MKLLWIGVALLCFVSISPIFVAFFNSRALVSEAIFHLPDMTDGDHLLREAVFDAFWKSLVFEIVPSIIGIFLLVFGYRRGLADELDLCKIPLLIASAFLLWWGIFRIRATVSSLQLIENASSTYFSAYLRNLVLQIHVVWLLTDALIIFSGASIIGIVVHKIWREIYLRAL